MSVGSTIAGTLGLRRGALVVVAMVGCVSLISACSAVATEVSFATQTATRPAQPAKSGQSGQPAGIEASAAQPRVEGSPAEWRAGQPVAAKLVPQPLTVSFSPAPGTIDVRPDQAVRVAVSGGRITNLAVTTPEGPAQGTVQGGEFRAAQGLGFATEYRLAATVIDDRGRSSLHEAAFSTLAAAEVIEAWVTPTRGDVVGVGMPVIVQFSDEVPAAERAAVAARLAVHSEPKVAGAWRWVNAAEVHWRPLAYWAARTRVWVAADLAGSSAGGRWFTASTQQEFSIGDHHRITIDAASHQMVAYRNGELVRTMPISAGRDDYPTASGVDLIMEKYDVFEMDSTSVGIYGADAYNVVVDDAQRLTNSGTFLHAAPWNNSLGEANLSHGCINASNEDAQWMMDFTLIGDPVEISNTPERVAPGNGWGDWNLTAEQWMAG